VTSLKSAVPAARHLGLLAIDGEIMKEAIETYLASPIFQAARYEELVLDDNPYRRPVRPGDIGIVDFSRPLRREDFSQLSGLMGHRMLLNIHDSMKLLLPRDPTAQKWSDYQLFYSDETRFLGGLIRPYLEAHLFGFVRDEARQRAAGTAQELAAAARDEVGARQRRAAELSQVVRAATDEDRQSMIQMLAIQSDAASLNAGTRPAWALRNLAGSVGLPGVHSTQIGGELLRRLADGAGIKYEPHSYFQFYLPSTLALMNYLNGAALEPGQAFALVGALLAQALETRDLESALGSVLDGRLEAPAPGSQVDRQHDPLADADAALTVALEIVERVGGEFAVREFGRGLNEYTVLLQVHHEDRMRQLTWINAMPAYVEKARRLQQAISDYSIDVDLDTFVESWEECSTTHVHNEDRLLVIESGQMEFWNCFGRKHEFLPGDMTFIPRHRLHGSVVLSGECVYHQPVITSELDRRFG
jgi:mannose-6-phosphate isomerase-like protein (cupin superfamily)